MNIALAPDTLPIPVAENALTGDPSLSHDTLVASLFIAEIHDRDTFISLQAEWDALAHDTSDLPFYRHEFFRIWLDNFAPRADLRVLVGRDPESKLVAALPLMREQTRLLGLPARQLVSVANDHTPRFDMLALDPQAAGRSFFRQLAALDGWDILLIRDVPAGGSAWHLYYAAQGAGYPVGTWDSLLSPYITLPATMEALERGLDAKFRANLRRRMRKLETLGRVTFERIEGGLTLEGELEQGYALEASGWKGRGGTAILQDTATRGFYSELARAASYGGYLTLYLLRLDGEPVAFQYGLHSGRRYYLLKPAYSEAVKECSPGHILMREVVRDLIERGAGEVDFLGPDMEWKRDWSGEHARQHTWLFIFNRTPYARFLHTMKFRWARSLKRFVRR
jgi:CelD/BcsL family acetyltransferase involved in cellulose biosynthesis